MKRPEGYCMRIFSAFPKEKISKGKAQKKRLEIQLNPDDFLRSKL